MDQAKDGQESTFYMTTPPVISVRLLSPFLASEKENVLLAALFTSVSNRHEKKTIYLLFATG